MQPLNTTWFTALVPTSHLVAGGHFKVCIDLDGTRSILPLGDSGVVVYVSPIISIAPTSIRPLTQGGMVNLVITCSDASACSSATEAYLDTVCADNSTNA